MARLDAIEHLACFAVGLGFDQGQIGVALGVLDREEAGEHAADDQEGEDRGGDDETAFQDARGWVRLYLVHGRSRL